MHVAMDDDGLIPAALEETIRRTAAASGRRAKFLYTVPNFHNPAGVTLAAGRRHRILRDLPAVRACSSSRTTHTACSASTASRCARCAPTTPRGSSTSARSPRRSPPGVRVGWAVAPAAIREKLILAAESAVLCHSSFSQLTVREYLATQSWREQIKDFRELYRERRDATLTPWPA